jgi:DHA2 family metal-tetracycline-proton antiporter-like MFS transporter
MTRSDPTSNGDRPLFWACLIALVATSFVFGVRSTVIGEIAKEFNLSEAQKGRILGVGLWPFALSIILFSLIIDWIGYKTAALFAVACHLFAIALTLMARPDNDLLYWGTFAVALANGTVEAFINPVVATVFSREKAKWLNILHAGWPLGMVLGTVFTLALGDVGWKVKFSMCFLPVVVYMLLLIPRKFPVHERVTAGVSYRQMLREFGAVGFFMFAALVVMAVYQSKDMAINWPVVCGIAGVVAAAAGFYTRSFGRPMFLVVVLIMPFLATTELGTDTWMQQLLELDLGLFNAALVFIYTSAIMTALRFCAGPIVHRFSPIGLLVLSAAVAIVGLLLLAGLGGWAVLVAATVYAFGKTFLWSSTLGMTAEQFPRGGALTLNGVTAIGVLGMGVLGTPFMGYLQDHAVARELKPKPFYQAVAGSEKATVFGPAPSLRAPAIEQLPEADKEAVTTTQNRMKKRTFAWTAWLPAFMLVCYLGLFLYFRSRGGYRPVELTG